MRSFVDDASSLYVRTGRESCNKFLGEFLDLSVRPFVLRVTGGCGLMGPEHAQGLQNVRSALYGGVRGSKLRPRFSGFCLFGGTRMVKRLNPREIVPGITEIVPPMSRYCPESRTLGIVAKVGDLKNSRHGIIISDEVKPGEPPPEYVTIIHPDQNATLLVQPSADHQASWDDEFKECIEICDYLRKGHWQGLLLVYNGGGTVDKEIRAWAKLGQTHPFWRVLLINGSGRKADEFANDSDFLSEHPTVHVCENTEASIRAKLLELGALVTPPASLFRRTGRS